VMRDGRRVVWFALRCETSGCIISIGVKNYFWLIKIKQHP